jgi:hypothetical protein
MTNDKISPEVLLDRIRKNMSDIIEINKKNDGVLDIEIAALQTIIDCHYVEGFVMGMKTDREERAAKRDKPSILRLWRLGLLKNID